jgi:hypothetical protein
MTPIRPSRFLTLAFLGAAACLWSACAGSKDQTRPITLNLDSLNQVVEHNDSVESNHFFYEESFGLYHARYPGVDKSAYMRIARGKDQDFCLFKPDPSRICQETGDKFNDLNLKDPARDSYEAGLLSEGYNESSRNIRLWSSLGQLHIEEKSFDEGRGYLQKVLEVEPKNKWAKKQLAAIAKVGKPSGP